LDDVFELKASETEISLKSYQNISLYLTNCKYNQQL